MKNITKKGFLQKTIIAVLIVLSINFIIPTYSHADFGGVLFDPIADFLCSIGDAVVYIIEGAMTGTWGDDVTLGNGGFLVKDSDFWGGDYGKFKGGGGGESINPDEEFSKGWLGFDDSYYIPTTTYSPEQIFAGAVSGLDINFIHPKFSEGEGGSAARLQTTIAQWYVALRNLSVVALLSILVYVGIRIIISSSAGDKAKYKQFLMDWLIALCILFFMHYIMSFTLTIVDSICESIAGSGAETVGITTPQGSFKTNLLGAARFKTQYKDFGDKVTYLITYLCLVAYTVIFTVFYLKRMIMMAFLTMIAPLVAVTYPIDKMGDSKAQAFNSWLKEYIFNALIQPFHLIIYTVLVGTAMDFAQKNIIYTLVALGFILPAEKILRKFFGFDKAGATMGALGTMAAGSMLGKFASGRRPSGGGSGGGKGGGSDKDTPPTMKIRQKGTAGISIGDGSDPNAGPSGPSAPGVRTMPAGTATASTGSGVSHNLLDDGDNGGAGTAGGFGTAGGGQQAFAGVGTGGSGSGLGSGGSGSGFGSGASGRSGGSSSNLSRRQKFIRGVRNTANAHGGGKRMALKAAGGAYRMARAAARAGLEASGAVVGFSAGIASGKGIAGAFAGAQIGRGVGSRISDMGGRAVDGAIGAGKAAVSGTRSAIDTWNGNTDLQDDHARKQFMKSNALDDRVRKELTKANGGEAPTIDQINQEKIWIGKYADRGITDIDAIYNADAASKELFGNMSEEDRLNTASRLLALQLSDDDYKASNLKKKENYEAVEADLIADFAKNNPNASQEQLQKAADDSLTFMMKSQGKGNNVLDHRKAEAQQKAQKEAEKREIEKQQREAAAKAEKEQKIAEMKAKKEARHATEKQKQEQRKIESQAIRNNILSGSSESSFKAARTQNTRTTNNTFDVNMPKFDVKQDRTKASKNTDFWTPPGSKK